MHRNDRREFLAVKEALLLGFEVSKFGVLEIRKTDQLTYEVEWEIYTKPKADGSHPSQSHWKSFPERDLDKAVKFFVNQRHIRRIGIEYEKTSAS